MSETKYLKQIQSRLSRKGIKVSYDDIRPTYEKHSLVGNPTEEQLAVIVEELTEQNQPTDIMLTESPEPKETNCAEGISSLQPPGKPEPATEERRPIPALLQQESSTLPKTQAGQPAETSLILSQRPGLAHQEHTVTAIAPQEAIEIIQEIATDESSQNKALAQRLLEQANEKTDTIVALVAALPEIEAEMLKRKLQRMPRKQVNYEQVLNSYFQESKGFSSFVSTLAGEYGINLSQEGKRRGEPIATIQP